MKKRAWGGTVAATVALCTALSGCAAPEAPQTPSGDAVFWGYWDGEVADQITAVLDEFNEETGANVTYVAQADMMNAFQASAIAGDVPDIMLWDAQEVRRYGRLGQLAPLNEHLDASGVSTADFNDQSMVELTADDQVYGLPVNLDIWGVYVNLGILAEAGVDAPPATWDEVAEAAEAAMAVDGVTAGINLKMAPYLFNSFLYANGGTPLSDDETTVNLDSHAEDVLDYFRELIDAGAYSSTYAATGGGDGFVTGEEAMTLWPTSMLRTYQDYADQIDFTFMPIPEGRASGSHPGGIQTSWSLVTPANAENGDTAKAFIEWAAHQDENSLRWAEILGGFSALKSVQNDPQFANDPYLKNILADLDNHVIRSDAPGFTTLEGTVYAPEIQKLFEGTQSVADTLTVMKREGDLFLEQARSSAN